MAGEALRGAWQYPASLLFLACLQGRLDARSLEERKMKRDLFIGSESAEGSDRPGQQADLQLNVLGLLFFFFYVEYL